MVHKKDRASGLGSSVKQWLEHWPPPSEPRVRLPGSVQGSQVRFAGSSQASERFFSGYSGFSLSSKPNIWFVLGQFELIFMYMVPISYPSPKRLKKVYYFIRNLEINRETS